MSSEVRKQRRYRPPIFQWMEFWLESFIVRGSGGSQQRDRRALPGDERGRDDEMSQRSPLCRAGYSTSRGPARLMSPRNQWGPATRRRSSRHSGLTAGTLKSRAALTLSPQRVDRRRTRPAGFDRYSEVNGSQ
jgi:hypothetical protein